MSDQTASAENAEFDAALIAAAFSQAALLGWGEVSVAAAARSASLPLGRARARFPGRTAILLRFGVLVDQAALAQDSIEATERERLFDLLMRRFDAMQMHRDGILALLRSLPFDPGTAAVLLGATLRSMGWMLEGAGISSAGVQGALRAKGLLGVWLATLRAWERDDSPDLSGTMAALDKALSQAERVAGWLGLARSTPQQSGLGPEQASSDEAGSITPDRGKVDADSAVSSSEADLGGSDGRAPTTPPPPPVAEPPASPPV